VDGFNELDKRDCEGAVRMKLTEVSSRNNERRESGVRV
jgi:hypothetical protein